MTNQDDEFQQRWEFRRGGDDEDSSTDDSKSSSHQVDQKHNIVDCILLHDDDEVSDSPGCHKGDNIDTNNRVVPLYSVEVAKKKAKSNKKTEKKIKKSVVPKRSSVVAKGNKKRNRNLVYKDMVMLEDLKTFADSLIHELKVAREEMSAQMWKLAASRPRKKKVGCCKKKAQNRSSVDWSMKSNVTSDVSNSSKAVVEFDQTQNEPQKDEKSCLPKRARMTLATDSDRVVSSLFLPPKPQLQGHKNGIPFNDRILGGVGRENLEVEIGKLIQSGSFPHISSKNVDFLGQNCTPTANGIGFLPNMSRQTYSENAFRDKSEGSREGNSATLKFSSGNTEYILGNSIRSDMHYRTEGEFVPLRLQELKNDQVYMASLRNKL